MTRRAPALGALVVLLLAGTAGCTSGTPAASPTGTTPAAHVTLTVYAAASLTGPFDDIATAFDKAHPGVTTIVSYDGSSTLATQITEGAHADVFASADQANMDTVTSAGLAKNPVIFTSNTLTIVVPADNPAGITSLADLARPGVKTVVCAPQVPCGAVATKVTDAASVTLHPVSEEQNVKAVMTKVVAGEADAGLVYTTDVRAAGSAVKGIALPAGLPTGTRYPIAVLTASPHADLARQLVDFITTGPGQTTLRHAGFTAP